MDRCPNCNKRMKTVLSANGRTEFQCLQCDKADARKNDAVNWDDDILTAPTKAA